MATSVSLPDLDRLRPAGTKRSSKRDQIVNAFLKQEGHLSADDLVDMIKREDHRISRATVYRTLQWMVAAGIARKVDFGEGRFRFEHSYRHPRHYHLICKTCNRSFEFLSSDIESLVEEVAAARKFSARQSVVQIYGTCEACQAGRVAQTEGSNSELLFARDAMRIAIATERSGREFYTRAARLVKNSRGRHVFEKLAEEEVDHLHRLEARYKALLERDPQLESQPTFLFFKGAANGLFAEGTEQLRKPGVDEAEALRIGIRCERGSHKFFKRYGERFEDSEGKQIFLEFAEEEREHLELLIREYRALITRRHAGKRRAGRRGAPPGAGPEDPPHHVIDLHLHTTASDGRCSPTELVRRVHAAGVRVFAVTDHDTVAGHDEAAAAARAHDLTFVPGIEITAVWAGRDVHVLGYWIDGHQPAVAAFLSQQRARRVERVRAIGEALARAGAPVDLEPLLAALQSRPGAAVGRPDIARLLVAAGQAVSMQDAFDRLPGRRPPGLRAAQRGVAGSAAPIVHDAGGLASLAHPGVTRRDERLEAWAAAGLDAIEAYHSDHSPADQDRYLERARALGLLVTGGSDFHGDDDGDQPARGPSRRRRGDPADGGVDRAGGAPDLGRRG